MATRTINASMTLPALTMSASVSVLMPRTINASMTLPALTMSAAADIIPTVQVSAALDIAAMISAAGNIKPKPAKTGGWPYHISRRVSTTYRIQAYGSRETKALAMRYGLWLTHPYHVRYVNPVHALHDVRVPLRLMHTEPVAYGPAPIARASWGAAYGPAPIARTMWGAEYNQAERTRLWIKLEYGSASPTRRTHHAAYHVIAAAARRTMGIAYDITTDTRVRSSRTISYSIHAPESAVIASMPIIACTYGRLLRLSLGQGIDTVVWKAGATMVMDTAPQAGDTFDLAIDATRWRLQVASARLSVLHPESTYELDLQSMAPPAAQQPIRDRDDRAALHGGLASDLVRALWPGVTVHWGVPDAVITPPQMHTLWDSDAIAATVALARACGGIAIMRPGADAIDVLPPMGNSHAVTSPIEYQRAIAKQHDIALVETEPRDTISVRQTGSDRAEIIVIPNPARNVSLRLTAPHVLVNSAPDIEQRDELIELRDGVGSVSAPILTLDRAQVYPSAALRYRGTAVWIDTPTPAAARVVYKTRILRAIAQGAPDTSSIAVVEDASP